MFRFHGSNIGNSGFGELHDKLFKSLGIFTNIIHPFFNAKRFPRFESRIKLEPLEIRDNRGSPARAKDLHVTDEAAKGIWCFDTDPAKERESSNSDNGQWAHKFILIQQVIIRNN